MKIKIKESVIEDLMDFARNTHPKEFMCFLEGNFDINSIEITGLIYQHFESSWSSASVNLYKIPIGLDNIGTAHSHPSSNFHPSEADSSLFNKVGGIHIIISNPYREENIHVFDLDMNELEWSRSD